MFTKYLDSFNNTYFSNSKAIFMDWFLKEIKNKYHFN